MRFQMWRAFVWALLGFGLVVASSSASTPPKAHTSTSKTKPAGTNKTSTENNNVIASLHQAKKLLDTAIHDYDGHRAKAVSEIHHAIHQLTEQEKGQKGGGANGAGAAKGQAAGAVKGHQAGTAKGNGVGTQKSNATGGGAATTTPGETQAQSDAQLQEALQILTEAHGQVGNATAAEHVGNAIGELNIALKIK
jgi:hypothetical protein